MGVGVIIAGYAGIGKSNFCQMTESSIDIPSMIFKWVLPPNKDERSDYEAQKASPYLLHNQNFPYNYIKDILNALELYNYVVIPSIERVLTILEHELKIPYILVYPDISLKEEYRERYIQRGNNNTFLEIFVDGYKDRIRNLQDDTFGIHIKLSAGEHLIDVKDKIDAAANTIKQKNITIDKYACERYSNLPYSDCCICIPDYTGTNYIFSLDITTDTNREWIYKLGKRAYEKHVMLVSSIPYEFYFNDDGILHAYTEILKSKEAVLKKIEELADE